MLGLDAKHIGDALVVVAPVSLLPLLPQARKIGEGPMLGDLAILEAVDAIVPPAAAGRRRPAVAPLAG